MSRGTLICSSRIHRFSFFFSLSLSLSLSPRLNTVAESKTGAYDEQANYLKLYFPEGEIDFIVSRSLTARPVRRIELLGRAVAIETDAEILAKKLVYRGTALKARDILDIACVLERSPGIAPLLRPFYVPLRDSIHARVREHEAELREDFLQLDVWEYERDFDSCIEIMTRELGR